MSPVSADRVESHVEYRVETRRHPRDMDQFKKIAPPMRRAIQDQAVRSGEPLPTFTSRHTAYMHHWMYLATSEYHAARARYLRDGTMPTSYENLPSLYLKPTTDPRPQLRPNRPPLIPSSDEQSHVEEPAGTASHSAPEASTATSIGLKDIPSPAVTATPNMPTPLIEESGYHLIESDELVLAHVGCAEPDVEPDIEPPKQIFNYIIIPQLSDDDNDPDYDGELRVILDDHHVDMAPVGVETIASDETPTLEDKQAAFDDGELQVIMSDHDVEMTPIGVETIASDESPTVKDKQTAWQQHTDGLKATARRNVDAIFKAHDDRLLGDFDLLASSLADTLDRHFTSGSDLYYGEDHELGGDIADDDPEKGQVEDFYYCNYTREDVLSLWRGNWLTDGIIDTLLTIMFPTRRRNRTCLAHTVRFNAQVVQAALYIDPALDPALLDATLNEFDVNGDPSFSMEPEVEYVVGAMNERNMHWFAWEADRSTGTITIYDSWKCADDLEEGERRSKTERQLELIFNYYSRSAWASEAWIDISWRAVRDPVTFQQTNSDDCGVHTLRNIQERMYRRAVLPFHDAYTLRYRYAHIIHEAAGWSSGFHWGTEMFDDEKLVAKWRTGPTGVTSRGGTVASTGTSPTSTPNEFELLAAVLQAEVFTDFEVPDLQINLPIRECALAILATHNPDGMTINELALRCIAIGTHLGVFKPPSPHGNLSKMRKRIQRVFGGRTTGIRPTGPDSSGDMRYCISDPVAVNAQIAASGLTFFGNPAMQHYQKMDTFKDDIDTRPNLVIHLGRLSGRNRGKSAIGLLEDSISDENMDDYVRYYSRVHNGRSTEPIGILDADDLILDAANVEDDWHFVHYYAMSPRASWCRPFQNEYGYDSRSDRNVIEILEKLDSHAEALGLKGDDRPLVTWVPYGVDCWFTQDEG